jgi:hypothetical protein
MVECHNEGIPFSLAQQAVAAWQQGKGWLEIEKADPRNVFIFASVRRDRSWHRLRVTVRKARDPEPGEVGDVYHIDWWRELTVGEYSTRREKFDGLEASDVG